MGIPAPVFTLTLEKDLLQRKFEMMVRENHNVEALQNALIDLHKQKLISDANVVNLVKYCANQSI